MFVVSVCDIEFNNEMPLKRKTTAYEKRLVAARAEWKCASCGLLLDETYEIDHVVSLAMGGEDSLSNLVPLHASCHRKKTLLDEMERIERRRNSRSRWARRPPLRCTRCEWTVSPYFSHECDPKSVFMC